MDTSSLKYFITVAQLQHMSRAAEQLNITQPSLSASIKRLESELGYRLFDRTKHGIRLNEYGRIFLKGVTESDAIMNRCLAEMETLKKASLSLVRLSCSNSPSNSRLIDLLLSEGMIFLLLHRCASLAVKRDSGTVYIARFSPSYCLPWP